MLIAPVKKRILAIDPGFTNGCKIAALEKNGNFLSKLSFRNNLKIIKSLLVIFNSLCPGDVLATTVIFPHNTHNQRKSKEAESCFIELAKKFRLHLYNVFNSIQSNVCFLLNDKSLLLISYLISKLIFFRISLFAIGNGTACRETETFISDMLKSKKLNGQYTYVFLLKSLFVIYQSVIIHIL